MANDIYALSDFDKTLSPALQSTIVEAKKIWAEASALGDKSKMEYANNMANSARAQGTVSYSGGVDGDAFIPVLTKAKETVQAVFPTADQIAGAFKTVFAGTPADTSRAGQAPTPTTTEDVSYGAGAGYSNYMMNDGSVVMAPISDNMSRIIKMFLVVVAIGFISKIFVRGKK